MLTRDEALKICETVLSHARTAGAEDSTVSLQSSVESHARFADNRITTSGRSDDVEITATVWVGKRRGAVTGNDVSATALKRLADEAVEIARISPVHREYMPTLGPVEYAESRGFAEATAEVDVKARATALEAVLADADRLARASPAPVPVNRKKTGAQMWVIQRVKKRGAVVLARLVGLAPKVPKKSRVWSRAMRIMTSPRRTSTDSIRGRLWAVMDMCLTKLGA